MGKLSYLDLAEKVLKEAGKPLAPSEIWALAKAKGYDGQLKSVGKTPWQTLYAAVFLDARDNADSIFIKIGTNPARYGLENSVGRTNQQLSDTEIQNAVAAANPASRTKLLEKDLHQYLTYFADFRFGALTKTISHSVSKKDQFGEWVHPDIVGIKYPNWQPQVIELGRMMGSLSAKFYSFELKRELSFANLRESFFQAVSNSTWANEGYLVTATIKDDEELLSELRRLSLSFGIGIIKLDVEDPDQSEVLLAARERDYLDWETLNKLAEMNSDVQKLLARVGNDFKTHEPRREEYDRVQNRDELLEFFRERS